MTVSDRLAGRLLDRRYRVGTRIARGGMATVYRGTDTRLDREVALKVMHPGLAGDPAFVSRFVREARCAARLTHPNLVAVYDQGEVDDTLFLAMEYVPGRTLRDLVRDNPEGLPPATGLELVEPVVSALAAAHAAGFVHRDIKPENVLLADDGSVKVADFGLVRAVGASAASTATSGLLVGSVSYLAPELVVDGRADARCDVYAVGIVVWELLTGRKPHEAESPFEIAYKHVHSDVPAPSSIRDGIPPELDDLVLAATARDPARRPADAGILLGRLHTAQRAVSRGRPTAELTQADRSGTEPTLVGPELAAPVPRRRLRRTGLALLCLALIAALGAGGWYFAVARFTTTPTVLRLPMDEARSALRAAGLSFSLSGRDWSETVPAGSVISTDPRPGERVVDNGQVSAVVSRGPHRFDVPPVIGLPRSDAVAALRGRRLHIADVYRRYNESRATGTTIRVRPAPGTPLRAGTGVVLILSRGPRPIAIPDLHDKDAARAQQRLERLGFSVATRERHDDEAAEGTVLGQRPSGGTGHRGDRVQLVISLGPRLAAVPDVGSFGVEAAKAALSKAGFQVEVETYEVASFGLGFVVEQRPSAGTMAPLGSTVTVYLV